MHHAAETFEQSYTFDRSAQSQHIRAECSKQIVIGEHPSDNCTLLTRMTIMGIYPSLIPQMLASGSPLDRCCPLEAGIADT